MIMRVPKALLFWHSIILLFVTVSLILYSTFSQLEFGEIDELIWFAAIPFLLLFNVMWFADLNVFIRGKFILSFIVLFSYIGFSIGIIFFENSFISVIPRNSSDVIIHSELAFFTFLNFISCIIFYQQEGWDSFIPSHRM